MRRRGLQLSRRHRLTLYAAGISLLISGAAWAWANHLEAGADPSETVRRLKPVLLQVHGLSAMVFVLLLGTLLPLHVRRAWRADKNKRNGGFFLSAIALLTLSGYLLYYVGDEAWRSTLSNFHLWLGLLSPAWLLWHIRAGRNATRS